MKRIIEMTSATAIGPAGCRRRCRLFLFLSLPFFRAILFVCLFVFFFGSTHKIVWFGSVPSSVRASERRKEHKRKRKTDKRKRKEKKNDFQERNRVMGR